MFAAVLPPIGGGREEGMMGRTEENLAAAFAGESQANRKYLAFARKADAEGYNGIAKLFRAAAHAETIHALAELNDLGGVKSTTENLKAAVAGETHEYTDMYVRFLEEARADGVKEAARTFAWAKAAEEVHARLYAMALEAAEKGQDLKIQGAWVCEKCGNIEFGALPEKCSLCGHPKEWFRAVD
jgi:rubrerythrin